MYVKRKIKSVLKNRIVVDCNSNKKHFLNKSLYRVLEFLHNLRKQQKQSLFKFKNSISQCFSGYCAYYNTNNKEIMENYDQGFECLKFPAGERCPPRYPSSEAYKCKKKILNRYLRHNDVMFSHMSS